MGTTTLSTTTIADFWSAFVSTTATLIDANWNLFEIIIGFVLVIFLIGLIITGFKYLFSFLFSDSRNKRK